MRTRRQHKKKRAGAYGMKKSTTTRNIKMSMGGPTKPMVSSQDYRDMVDEDIKMRMPSKAPEAKQEFDTLFQKEKESSEEDAFSPEVADKVIDKFREFVDELEEKEEKAIEDDDHEALSELEIIKLTIANALVEAFGKKAKTAPKAEAPSAFDDDLASLLSGLKL